MRPLENSTFCAVVKSTASLNPGKHLEHLEVAKASPDLNPAVLVSTTAQQAARAHLSSDGAVAMAGGPFHDPWGLETGSAPSIPWGRWG